jgi:signal transduction histidine kinase
VAEPADVHASRARLAAAAIGGRRSLERALHNGVQQDLIAISVRLQLVRELLRTDVAAASELLEELRLEAHEALDRVRALGGGVYPSILDSRGLADAVREAARATRSPARVHASGLARYPADVEATAFFCCRAALEGAAPDAPTIRIQDTGEELRVEIDSAAWDVVAARDLVESMGGTLVADGDRVTAALPLSSPTRLPRGRGSRP